MYKYNKAESFAKLLFGTFLLGNAIFSLVIAIIYFGPISLLFVFLATFSRLYLISYFKKPLSTPLRSLLVVHIELSYSLALFIREIQIRGSMGYNSTETVFVFGQICIITIAFVYLFQSQIWKPNSIYIDGNPPQWYNWTIEKGVSRLLIVFLVATIFSIISFKFGITRMGIERVSLPFNLAGALDWPRKFFFPALFFIGFGFFHSKNNRGGLIFAVLLFFAWTILESYITFSKSKMLQGFILPLMFFSCYTKRITRLILFTGVSIVFAVALLSTELNAFRNIFNSSTHSDENYSQMLRNKTENVDPIDRVDYLMTRIFRDGHRMQIFLEYSDNAFVNNRIVDVFRSGGTISYISNSVFRVSDKASSFHAEGSSAIPEAYLIGGYPLAIFTLIFLAILYGILDERRFFWPLAYPGIQIACALFSYNLLVGGVWAWLSRGFAIALIFPVTLYVIVLFLQKKNTRKYNVLH